MCKITRISRVYTMCLTRVTRENFTGFPREIHMLLLVGYCYIKKHWHRKLTRSKNWFWEDPRVGPYPQTTPKYLYLKYLLTAKNTGTLA